MKNVIYIALACLCAYGILVYALNNPTGANKLREDIGSVTAEAIEKGSEAAVSAGEYVKEVTSN